MRIKKNWLALTSITIGAWVILYAIFSPYLLRHNDYVADYNEGVKSFVLSIELDSREHFVESLKNFQIAFSEDPPSRAKATILYNIVAAYLENMQRAGTFTVDGTEIAIASLKEAGRYDSYDMDIKYNLDILLRLKLSSGEAGKGKKSGEGEEISPLPNLEQNPGKAKEDDKESYNIGDEIDEKSGSKSEGEDPVPDF